MSTTTGKVSQIIGPVIDVEFNTENNELPKIYDSLEIKKADGSILVLEVQHTLVKILLEQFLWMLLMG